MKTPVLKQFWLCLLCISLSACGVTYFTHPKATPIIEDEIAYDGESVIGTLATTADRRIVLIKLNDIKESGIGRFCAEPPPDAAENIVSQLALALEAAAQTPQAQGTGRLEFQRQLATTIQQLFHRTQGVQFYRDGFYNLCQSFLNQVISPAEFRAKTEFLMTLSYALIMEELRLTHGNVGGPPPVTLPAISGVNLSSGELRSLSPDGLAAKSLIVDLENLKSQPSQGEDDKDTQAKVILTKLYDILVSNAKLDSTSLERTLSDEDLSLLLDKLRPLAKNENQQKLVLPSQLQEFNNVEDFHALFVPFSS